MTFKQIFSSRMTVNAAAAALAAFLTFSPIHSRGQNAPPAGTTVAVRMIQAVNSGHASVGQPYRAVVAKAVDAGGITIPAGAAATVALAKTQTGWAIELTSLTIGGQAVTVTSSSASMIGSAQNAGANAVNTVTSALVRSPGRATHADFAAAAGPAATSLGGAPSAGQRASAEAPEQSATAASSPQARQTPDQDPRLAQLSPQYREQALAYMSGSKDYCQNNAVLSGLFDCDCFARIVLNYHITHGPVMVPSGPILEPLTSLLLGDKLDCSQCISEERITKWVTHMQEQAKAAGGVTNVACTSQRLLKSWRARPFVGAIRELYNEAYTDCAK